jgi:hypothetical protein
MSWREKIAKRAPRVKEVMQPKDSARVAKEQIKAAKAIQAKVDLEKAEARIKEALIEAGEILAKARAKAEDTIRQAQVYATRITQAAEQAKVKFDEDISREKDRLVAREGSLVYAEGVLKQDQAQLSRDQEDLKKEQTALGALSQKLANEGTRLAALDKTLQARCVKQEEEQAKLLYLESALKDRDIELREWDNKLSNKQEDLSRKGAQAQIATTNLERDTAAFVEERKVLVGEWALLKAEKDKWILKLENFRKEYSQLQKSCEYSNKTLAEVKRREEEVERKERNLAKKARELGYQREELRGAEKAQEKKRERVIQELKDRVAKHGRE